MMMIPSASLSAIPPAGDHLVQIARTLYRPAPVNASEGLWYAPQGEASVHDSILRAIHSAREYIYIEDQYITPANSHGAGDEILEALKEAAARCKALILVFPHWTNEQLFGRDRRNAVCFVHPLCTTSSTSTGMIFSRPAYQSLKHFFAAASCSWRSWHSSA